MTMRRLIAFIVPRNLQLQEENIIAAVVVSSAPSPPLLSHSSLSGNVFCSKCSDYKAIIPSSSKKERVRVCVNCLNEINQEVSYLSETLPILQRGETFKIKSLLGLSSKYISLRLMADGKHLCYEDNSSNSSMEPILLSIIFITHIIPTSFVSFDLHLSSSNGSKSTIYSFEAENKDLQQLWIVSLKQLLEYFEKQNNFHKNNEMLRQRKKLEMKQQLEQEQQALEAEAGGGGGGEVGGGEEEMTRGRGAVAKEQRKMTRDQIREKYGLNK
jgi:hypothetical protein